MKPTELRTLIKESIQEYIREVETSGNVAAQEAKIRACEEAISLRERKINMEGLDEAFHDMIDETKKKNLEKEIKELQKYKAKAEKLLKKMQDKASGKSDTKEKEETVDEIIDEVNVDELTKDPESGPQLEEELDGLGIDEAKKKPSAGLSAKQKSDISKKAHAGKDIGKKGKSFEKVAQAAGGGEKGEKIAAAAMWKGAAKRAHESVESEGEVINESFLHMQKLAGLITEAEYKAKSDINQTVAEVAESKISSEAYTKMNSLVKQQDYNSFVGYASNIMEMLLEEGFEARDILNYLFTVLENEI